MAFSTSVSPVLMRSSERERFEATVDGVSVSFSSSWMNFLGQERYCESYETNISMEL